MASRSSSVTIRIRRVPPTTGFLQQFDLGSYGFREARAYRVPRAVAEVLIAWNYAERLEDAGEPALEEGES
jgi:hypothetical protein